MAGLEQEPQGRWAREVVRVLITDTVRLIVRSMEDDGSVIGGNAAVPLDSCDEPMDRARETGAGIQRESGAHQRPWEFRQGRW